MPTHPGGEDLIKNELGTNIEEAFEEAEHTKSARNIFKDLPVVGYYKSSDNSDDVSTSSDIDQAKKSNAAGLDGYVLESKFNFDYTRGLW